MFRLQIGPVGERTSYAIVVPPVKYRSECSDGTNATWSKTIFRSGSRRPSLSSVALRMTVRSLPLVMPE